MNMTEGRPFYFSASGNSYKGQHFGIVEVSLMYISDILSSLRLTYLCNACCTFVVEQKY